jgi:hypothetical protein
VPEPHPIGVDDGSCTDLIFITEHLRAWRPWQTITTATVPDTTTAAIGTTDVRVAVTPDAVAGLIMTISLVAMRAPDAAVTAIAVTMASVATTEADLRGAPGMMIVAAMSSIMAMATALTGIARDTAATGTTTGAVDVTVAGSVAETTAGIGAVAMAAGEIDRTIATRAVPGTIDAAGAAGRTGVTAPGGVTTGTVSIRTVNTGATVTGRIVGIAPKVAAAGTVPIETNTVTLTDSAETGAMIDRALGDAGTTGVVATVAGMVVTRATGGMTSVMIGVPARTAAAGRTSATAAAMTAVVRRVVTTTGLTVVTVAMIAATAVAAVTIPGRRVARVLTSCSCRRRSRHATSP